MHELCHVAQFTEDETYATFVSGITIDQECDMRAILYLLLNEGNIRCAIDYARSRPEKSTQYLTRSVAEKLIAKIIASPEFKAALARLIEL